MILLGLMSLLFLLLNSGTAQSEVGQSGAGQSPTEGPTSGRQKGTLHELRDFLKLNQQLPKAVCDEAAVSRAPTLAGLGVEENQTESVFELELKFSEPDLMSFLMDDSAALLAHPLIQDQWRERQRQTGPAGLAALKRGLSLEVCSAVVTPGKLSVLLAEKPGVLMELRPQSKKNRGGRPSAGRVMISIQDVEGRFGKLNDRWWVAGWIEAFEVMEVRTANRVYRRLVNPVTNQTRFVEVFNAEGVPLGYFVPTNESAARELRTIQERATKESAETMKKRIQTYQLMMESEAFLALKEKPKQVGSIRKIKDFYANLIQAYQIYPDDSQFQSYRGVPDFKAKETIGVLDKTFFRSLGLARVNGVGLGLIYLQPDARLHSIYLDFMARLKKL